MADNKKFEFQFEIIETETKKDDLLIKTVEKKKSITPFKCPVCKGIIQLRTEIPDDVKVFPHRIEYTHLDHVLLIDIDNNYEIREIKPK